MANIVIWLSYDLGVSGDFQGLYSWLDDHEAIECGNSMAFLKFNYPASVSNDAQLDEFIKTDLDEKVKFAPTNRIYIIRKSIDKQKTIGNYLVGKRKANPWEGYGTKTTNTVDE